MNIDAREHFLTSRYYKDAKPFNLSVWCRSADVTVSRGRQVMRELAKENLVDKKDQDVWCKKHKSDTILDRPLSSPEVVAVCERDRIKHQREGIFYGWRFS